MKKRNIPVIVLLVLLIVVIGLTGFSFYRLQQTVAAIANDFTVTQTSTESGENSGSISTDGTVFNLYYGIYSNLEEYGVADQYEEQTVALANLMIDKTLKDCEVESIEYKDNGFTIVISGEGVPLSDFDTSMWTSAVTKAAGSFLSKHFFSAALSLFQGEDAIKQMLYTEFGTDIFDAVNSEISDMQTTQVRYTLDVTYSNNSWSLTMSDEQTG